MPENDTEPGMLVLNALGERIANIDACYDYGAKDLLIAMRNKLFGVIDLKGGGVILFDYASIQRVNNDYYIVQKTPQQTAVLDRTGATIYGSNDPRIANYCRGVVVLYDKSARTYDAVDESGKEIFPKG